MYKYAFHSSGINLVDQALLELLATYALAN